MHHQPHPQGLYDPRNEHDACGVAFVATLTGIASHRIVDLGLAALGNLAHRGASGAEPESGDGAGLLVQVPDEFLRAVVDFDLPPAGAYAVGLAFLPDDDVAEIAAVQRIAELAAEEDLRVLGWREVPTTPALLGATAQRVMPRFRQLFLAGGVDLEDLTDLALDRRAYCLRKRVEQETPAYFPSLSARTLVYKGMLTTEQLEPFFPDISDRRLTTALAVVHSRFSTNTFPSWPLAHPYRYIAHNGEINTVMGNRNWMRARESQLRSDLIPGDLTRLFPVCTPGASDSASFDEVLELLHLGGRSLAHAMLMMIPEAWENHAEMSPQRRAFYGFHSTIMEPWDGPAAVVFTDGTRVGAMLDRNGLRPGRFWVTEDGLVVLASETGVLDVDPATVVRKGRLQPGRMFLVDLDEHRVIEDDEIKADLAAGAPYDEWLHAGLIHLEDLPDREHVVHTHASVTRRQQTFGYTEEELRVLLAPMARAGVEPIGSMGTDTPIATLSDRPRLLFDYFTQLFAQVTNPPLDAIREELVTSLRGTIGPENNLLDATASSCRQVALPFPVIDNDGLAKIIHINRDGDLPGYGTHVVRGLFQVAGGGAELARRLDDICFEVSAAIADGARIVVLSDRNSDATWAPIPSLLLTAAVHHHLIREKTRTQVGLVVEAGDVRETHHVALLLGYGAAAVNPYLAMESVEDLARQGVMLVDVPPDAAVKALIKALGKGVLKVMSKMGVSTVASYTGAQIFEAIGLSNEVVNRYFTGTTSRLSGVGLDVLAEEVRLRHVKAYPPGGVAPAHRQLEIGGEYQWRREGEPHLFDPETVFRLQHSTRAGRYDIFKKYTQRVDEQAERLMTLRGMFRFTGTRAPIPIEEVEPVSAIVRRFSTGAMSYGSISREAHETLAIAMNRIGGRSNTGEGGEDADRLHDPERRSAVKQVASGRFGVTSEYLTYASDLQIEIGAGREARRRRPVARREGVPLDRANAVLDAGCRADLTTAASRHLLDRGPQAAHPRPQEREPVSSRARQTGRGGRRRDCRRRGIEGARGRGPDFGARRRNRCGTADQPEARRGALGARVGGDPADVAAQPPARPNRRAGGRAAQDRPGRRDRGPAGRRGVRLRDRATGRGWMHHDAGLPPGHLPGRRSDAEPGVTAALQRQAGVRRHVLRVSGRGGSGASGGARLPQPGRSDRARRVAGHLGGDRALEGGRA